MGRMLLVFAAVLTMATASYAATCKDYSSCEQAVRAWCAGHHPRADGDSDGIPCENVCPSKRVVDGIRAQIGC